MSGFLNNSIKVYPVKLKIGMLYHLNNTFRNTAFLDICQYALKRLIILGLELLESEINRKVYLK